jgi:arabinofuranosyltransferase
MQTTRADRAGWVGRAEVALAIALPLGMMAVGARSHLWLDDDGFINLRVVRNLLEGHGPVFNIGERVEACTSTLWTYLLLALGALGLRLEYAAAYAGIAFTVGALAAAMAAALTTARTAPPAPGPVLLLPLGAIAYAALPVAWDYASSGLETGLGLFWLASSYLLVVRGFSRPVTAVVLGLGPLIRPDDTVYAALLLLALARGEDARPELGSRSRALRLLVLAAAWGALPALYQIFRMGYYGALTPNPAIAKEAFTANWRQGLAYLDNFVGVYHLALPAALLFVLAILRLITFRRSRSSSAFDASLAVLVAAALHATYVVRLGGDYMHGRMLLTAAFALSLPVAIVPIPLRGGPGLARIRYFAASGCLFAWALPCMLFFRVDRENDRTIGDERGWYEREAKLDNPIAIGDYRYSDFYKYAEKALANARDGCPDLSETGRSCAPQFSLDNDPETHQLPSVVRPIGGEKLDPRIALVTSYSAMGIAGYLLPSRVYLADRLGLADPIGARLRLQKRGRPGHEKWMSNAWLFARLAAPSRREDAGVAAARRVLDCSLLPELAVATTAPLSWSRFFANIGAAPRLQRLRIPLDPFEAEERLCGAPHLPIVTAGGSGGSAYRWQCPEGSTLVGMHGSLQDDQHALAEVAGDCFDNGSWTASTSTGEPTQHRFDLDCKDGERVVGLFGRAMGFVHQLGLVCARPNGARVRSETIGEPVGDAFDLSCPASGPAIGIVGRSGALIDAIGIVCAKAGP